MTAKQFLLSRHRARKGDATPAVKVLSDLSARAEPSSGVSSPTWAASGNPGERPFFFRGH